MAVRGPIVGLVAGVTTTIPGPVTGLFIRGTLAMEYASALGEGWDVDGHRGQVEVGARWPFARIFDLQLGGYVGWRQRGSGWNVRTGAVTRLQIMRSARHKTRFGVFAQLDVGSYWEPWPNTYPVYKGFVTDPKVGWLDGSLNVGLVLQFRP